MAIHLDDHSLRHEVLEDLSRRNYSNPPVFVTKFRDKWSSSLAERVLVPSLPSLTVELCAAQKAVVKFGYLRILFLEGPDPAWPTTDDLFPFLEEK